MKKLAKSHKQVPDLIDFEKDKELSVDFYELNHKIQLNLILNNILKRQQDKFYKTIRIKMINLTIFNLLLLSGILKLATIPQFSKNEFSLLQFILILSSMCYCYILHKSVIWLTTPHKFKNKF